MPTERRPGSIVLCAAASALLLVQQAAQAEQTERHLPVDTAIMNDGLPLPDNTFLQTLKAVAAQLQSKAAQTPAMVTRTPAVEAASPQPVAGQAAAPAGAPHVVPAAAAPDVVPTAASARAVPPALQAELPSGYGAALAQVFDDLLAAARSNSQEFQLLDTAVGKWNNWRFRLGEHAKDMLNYACLFKGVAPSSEAGDVILDEKSKLKSLASAKYQRQKIDDGLQLRIASCLLEIAMHAGNQSSVNIQKLEQSYCQLIALAGPEAAEKAWLEIKSLVDADTTGGAPLTRPLWSVTDNKERVENSLSAATRVDPVISDITADIHHFNKHSPGALAAHRAAHLALNLAALTPTFVGPAANTVLFGYLTLTGGTEQEKILKELYIDKRLASRTNLLGEQSHLAFYNYQLGALTGNKLLMACARQLLVRMTDAETADRLLQPGEISTNQAAPLPAPVCKAVLSAYPIRGRACLPTH